MIPRSLVVVLVLNLLPVLSAELPGESSIGGGKPLSYFLPPGTRYDPRVPTPEQFLGWRVGEWHLRSELLDAYVHAVAAAAPERMRVERIGYTNEHKPLEVVIVSAASNLANLERIRMEHLALLDPSAEPGRDVSGMPVIVDMGYTIHGNEASGANAVPLVIYHLAAAQNEATDALLKNAVILVEPLRNPDGSDRAAQWFNSNRSRTLSADPESREHNEDWPRGRYNHYLFDPNRDWLPLVHPEAQARAGLFQRWRPNVLTDHHEMGTNNTFFFQPGVPSRNNPSSPPGVFDLTRKIAAYQQRAFDGRGLLYFSEQGFDDFYPGKGSTYPDLLGTVGILYEQASSRGQVQESDNGLLSFPFAIRNQVISTFATLDAALALRKELLEYQRDFARDTLELARNSATKAYVFGDDGDPARAEAFLELMARHHVEVRPLRDDLSVTGRTFRTGAAWVVPAEQVQYRLITEIFARRTTFEDPVFYDVSAWTLPLAYNLPYAALDRVPAGGDPVGIPDFPPGRLVGGQSSYAYVFNWNGYYAPRALLRLQKAGILVKGLTSAPVQAVLGDGTKVALDYGAVLVPVGLQPGKAKEIAGLVNTIVREDALTVYGCATGLTPAGVDFGSSSFVVLRKPAVALITGEGVDPHDIGAAWHVLDQRVRMPVTLLDIWALNRSGPDRYTALVLADGRYDSVSDEAVASLKRWISRGGTLIVMGRAAEWAAKKEIAPLEFLGGRDGPPPAAPARSRNGEPDPAAGRQPYGSAADREALKRIEGAIVAVTVDRTHPIGYGFAGDTLSLFRKNRIFLKPAKSPYATPAVYAGDPLQSGYVSADNLRILAHSAAVVALPIGDGCVVAMPDDPNFRGFWYGGNRLFFNAIFYGAAIRAVKGSND